MTLISIIQTVADALSSESTCDLHELREVVRDLLMPQDEIDSIVQLIDAAITTIETITENEQH